MFRTNEVQELLKSFLPVITADGRNVSQERHFENIKLLRDARTACEPEKNVSETQSLCVYMYMHRPNF
jgi:hypothetical protein